VKPDAPTKESASLEYLKPGHPTIKSTLTDSERWQETYAAIPKYKAEGKSRFEIAALYSKCRHLPYIIRCEDWEHMGLSVLCTNRVSQTLCASRKFVQLSCRAERRRNLLPRLPLSLRFRRILYTTPERYGKCMAISTLSAIGLSQILHVRKNSAKLLYRAEQTESLLAKLPAVLILLLQQQKYYQDRRIMGHCTSGPLIF
jgi:hypothetical protein